MKRSHTTQALQNYFDPNDVRVRQSPVCLDAQLLNLAAEQFDDFWQRLEREIDARLLVSAPTRPDNFGVYQAARVPSSFDLGVEGDPLPTVEGLRSGVWTALTAYDDRLPVPLRVNVDPTVDPVPLANPVFLDLVGTGNADTLAWDVKTVAPGTLAFGNKLTFYLEGMENGGGILDVYLRGDKYPAPAWPSEQKKTVEIVRVARNGIVETQFPWAVLDEVTVRGLPAGARLRGWLLPLTLPVCFDVERPASVYFFRDALLPKYWSVDNDNRRLFEQFQVNNFVGTQIQQTYTLPAAINGLALEPHTWGMFLASNDKLYYIDRREPMPLALEQTGLALEPAYGLQIEYDDTRIGPVTYVRLTPVPYAGAPTCNDHRYIIADPQGNLSLLLNDGSTAVYSPDAGWRQGIPVSLSLPLTKTGTYVFTIETATALGVTRDVVPYANLAATLLGTYDLGAIAPQVDGLAFDHLGRLWLWSNQVVYPLRTHYDAFVVDYDTHTVYLTDIFESVRFS